MVALPELPHDAIMEVLSRLPVKSIQRFKCACRFWFSLLSSPKFVQTHLNHLLNVDDQDRDRATKLLTSDHTFIYLGLPEHNLSKSFPIRSVFSSDPSSWINDAEVVPNLMPRFKIISGSCNGLFCLSCWIGLDYSLFFWNPSTRESRKLPPWLPPPRLPFFLSLDLILGFGYDHSADDYKVVRIEFSPPRVEVFSLEANSWKSVPPPSFGSFDLQRDPGILVGGSLNWLSSPSTPDEALTASRTGVASFHLGTHKFEIGPPFLFSPAGNRRVLCVLRGCLCLAYQTRSNPTDVHVWIMEEYGTISSWSLVATLTYPSSMPPRSPKPLCVFKDLILLHQRSVRGHPGAPVTLENILHLFDLKGKSLKHPVFFGILDAVIYVETLVSPYGN